MAVGRQVGNAESSFEAHVHSGARGVSQHERSVDSAGHACAARAVERREGGEQP